MRYPELPQLSTKIAARAPTPYSVNQSQFSKELADFVDFIGAEELDKAMKKIAAKLRGVHPATLKLHRDRYFFHYQFEEFIQGPNPFVLDVTKHNAVRTASIIAGANRVAKSLSEKGRWRLKRMVLDNLKPPRDVRQIEHELRCATHLGQLGYDVAFADLEELGRYDLLVNTGTELLEVECKTISEEAGSQIKADLAIPLMEIFRKRVTNASGDESGLFVLKLKRPAEHCKNLPNQLDVVLQRADSRAYDGEDFSLGFVSRSAWDEALRLNTMVPLDSLIAADPAVESHFHCAIRTRKETVFGLTLQPHKPNSLPERVIDVIQEGADKCTGGNKAVVWVHFNGVADAEFRELAAKSMDGSGGGLNNVVAGALSPAATSTDRSHVYMIRFSTYSEELSTQSLLAPSLLIVQARSNSGPLYDVRNPRCRFVGKTEL